MNWGLALAIGSVLGCQSRSIPPIRPAPAPSAPASSASSLLRDPPPGFVDLSATIEGLRVDIRYHGRDNFTGAPLTGYGAAGAWLREQPAESLGRVQRDLEAEGLGLLVYDAYRPVRATQAMVAWAERSGRVDVLDDGYVARKSGHNRGNTVDVTLVELASGQPLEMGTAWDTFSVESHVANAEGLALENRRRLGRAMAAHGWKAYAREWWHFSFPMEPIPGARDVPYGCFEPDEGQWTAPADWNEPGYAASLDWPLPAEARCE